MGPPVQLERCVWGPGLATGMLLLLMMMLVMVMMVVGDDDDTHNIAHVYSTTT